MKNSDILKKIYVSSTPNDEYANYDLDVAKLNGYEVLKSNISPEGVYKFIFILKTIIEVEDCLLIRPDIENFDNKQQFCIFNNKGKCTCTEKCLFKDNEINRKTIQNIIDSIHIIDFSRKEKDGLMDTLSECEIDETILGNIPDYSVSRVNKLPGLDIPRYNRFHLLGHEIGI